LERDTLSKGELNGKIIAFDAFNVIYQFITTVRGSDGKPLADSNGNPTSHLSGLLYEPPVLSKMASSPFLFLTEFRPN
jgi:5''-3'' exonuclease (including N-terminal domain of PolI)